MPRKIVRALFVRKHFRNSTANADYIRKGLRVWKEANSVGFMEDQRKDHTKLARTRGTNVARLFMTVQILMREYHLEPCAIDSRTRCFC
jgi:hypothetical protein